MRFALIVANKLVPARYPRWQFAVRESQQRYNLWQETISYLGPRNQELRKFAL
jgi:hypothetical protein